MIILLIQIVQYSSLILILMVLADIVLGYFMDPLHPVRRALDTIVQPMLKPLRRVIPPLGGMDFSPVVLVVLIQIAEAVLTRLLAGLL
jgi:YggT family protein